MKERMEEITIHVGDRDEKGFCRIHLDAISEFVNSHNQLIRERNERECPDPDECHHIDIHADSYEKLKVYANYKTKYCPDCGKNLRKWK